MTVQTWPVRGRGGEGDTRRAEGRRARPAADLFEFVPIFDRDNPEWGVASCGRTLKLQAVFEYLPAGLAGCKDLDFYLVALIGACGCTSPTVDGRTFYVCVEKKEAWRLVDVRQGEMALGAKWR